MNAGKGRIEPIYGRLGGEIKRLRLKRGMTQTQLADAMGYSVREHIAKVELGTQRIKLHDVPRYAEELGVTAMVLFKACCR